MCKIIAKRAQLATLATWQPFRRHPSQALSSLSATLATWQPFRRHPSQAPPGTVQNPAHSPEHASG
jgi:hypothetical protein